ncbi:MAG: NAD-dependent epimerase/dehydratase family protein [Candidatus Marinimicrobia bacterium]|nr:NAD-dependent epimerase/dehydratase family protein [Candidatus Neomarinimicrobiota bacterium]
MSISISVIGSTGLIGMQFLESISEGDYAQVIAITRRSIPSLQQQLFIKQAIHDFSNLEMLADDLKTDVLVCALGTTIKTAGSQARFMEVDHDIPLETARIAHAEGCKTFILISAVGANPQSSIFYSRVKGLLEEDLKELGFDRLFILRPGMLLGDRQEKRSGEFIGKLLMQPLNFLIPWKYKAIHLATLVSTIHHLIASQKQGLQIIEGKELFGLN